METQVAESWPEIKGIRLFPIHEKCKGCKKVTVFEDFDDSYCCVYANPSAVWHRGCPVATHVTWSSDDKQDKKRIGQQKSRKKKAKRAGL